MPFEAWTVPTRRRSGDHGAEASQHVRRAAPTARPGARRMNRAVAALAIALAAVTQPRLDAQQPASFKAEDGWVIHGSLSGSGERGVVLIHGGRFTKESWQPQAEELVKAGFRVLAI